MRIVELPVGCSLTDANVAIVNEGARLLLDGRVIIFPTDTVYGLMAGGEAAMAARTLNRLKKRDESTPVAALVNRSAPLQKVLKELSDRCALPLHELVPGPLTLVISREVAKGALPRPLLALPYATIGFRVPDYPALNALIEKVGGWVMATSANPTGVDAGNTLRSCLSELPHESIALAVDGGDVEGAASAVVDFTGDQPRVLRGHPRLTQNAS